MISAADAQRIVEAELRSYGEMKLVIVETIEVPFGWAFIYQAAKWVETGDDDELLVGNAPILVLRADGSVTVLGTHKEVEDQLREYAVERGLPFE